MSWLFPKPETEIALENIKLRAEVERMRKEVERTRDEYDKWEAEYEIRRERDQLRESLNLAERDNYRLHGIIAALRLEIREMRGDT